MRDRADIINDAFRHWLNFLSISDNKDHDAALNTDDGIEAARAAFYAGMITGLNAGSLEKIEEANQFHNRKVQ